MGQETRCRARSGDHISEGKAQLETDVLVFRGDFRLSIPFKDMKAVQADDGWLTITLATGPVSLELGPAAPRWAQKILHPPSRIDKLGVKAGMRIVLAGLADQAFRDELAQRTAEVSSRPRKEADLIFLAAETKAALKKISALRDSLKPAGAVWVVFPKGVLPITEADVLAAGREAGLTDVKVVRFSPTHTALKFVIPKAHRSP
jgi:hypothetical protein